MLSDVPSVNPLWLRMLTKDKCGDYKNVKYTCLRDLQSISITEEGTLFEFYNDGEILLFNLTEDPYEWNNLAEAMPEKRDELRQKMKAYLRKVKAKPGERTPEEIAEMQTAEECILKSVLLTAR